jgi:hypothetical protein
MKFRSLAIAFGAGLLGPCIISSAAGPDGTTITGPVATTSPLRDMAHGYPFNATPMDFAKLGYVEEEFILEGMASRYNTPPMATGSIIDGNHPYKTRIVVRRPKSPSRFNGTAIVEWTNVSQGHDNEVDWFQSGAHFVRAGYAWIGVSAQRVGVDALKQWSPSRYGSLDVSEGGAITNDALSYDIFAAAARAVRPSARSGRPEPVEGRGAAGTAVRPAGPDVMGGLKVERLIATGHSQSAGRLYTYFTSVHPLAPVFDGVVLHGGGGALRPDLDVKVWKFLSETDVSGQTRQPDTDRLRTWEVAGTSHLDAQLSRGLGSVGLLAAGGAPVDAWPKGATISGGGPGIGGFQTASTAANDGCAKPIFSRVPSSYVQNALYDHFAQWIKAGTPPPTAPPIEMRDARPGEVVPAGPGGPGRGPGPAPGGNAGGNAGGRGGEAPGPTAGGRRGEAPEGAPAGARRGGDAAAGAGAGARGGEAPAAPRRGRPPIVRVIARDEFGNALGGIRLSQHAVATATNTGLNTGGMFCGLLGSHEPFDAARLTSLYPTHDGYVAKVKEVTAKNLKWGYLVKADADATIEDAKRADIGKR